VLTSQVPRNTVLDAKINAELAVAEQIELKSLHAPNVLEASNFRIPLFERHFVHFNSALLKEENP